MGSLVILFAFSFSNRKDPNFAKAFRTLRMNSVRDCFLAAMSSQRWHVGSMGSIGRKSVEVYGCGIQESALFNIKTRHYISGYGRAVL